MALDILLGLQWGDEGKGKIVDLMAGKYDIVARFQGGPNAGHTLHINDQKYVFHTLPSGMIHDGVMNVIGSGMVIDPLLLKEEIETLQEKGLFDKEKLLIAKNAHLILPSHRHLDLAYENAKAEDKIGSTLKGIGPCYTDKMGRRGIQMGSILKEDFGAMYGRLKQYHLQILEGLGSNKSFDEDRWFEAVEFIKSLRLTNTELYLNDELDQGSSILAEGAQGTLLDINYGTYPYVTSSGTISAAACSGLGLPPNKVNDIFGVFKAYTTRVGEGPFPTELHDDTGTKLQNIGNEFGATTGRSRRCGWLDLPGLDYAVRLNGVTKLIMTKSDVFANLGEDIKVCTNYNDADKGANVPYPDLLDNTFDRNSSTPEFKHFQPWEEAIEDIKEYDHLPDSLKKFTSFIESSVSAPIYLISSGPQRSQYIYK